MKIQARNVSRTLLCLLLAACSDSGGGSARDAGVAPDASSVPPGGACVQRACGGDPTGSWLFVESCGSDLEGTADLRHNGCQSTSGRFTMTAVEGAVVLDVDGSMASSLRGNIETTTVFPQYCFGYCGECRDTGEDTCECTEDFGLSLFPGREFAFEDGEIHLTSRGYTETRRYCVEGDRLSVEISHEGFPLWLSLRRGVETPEFGVVARVRHLAPAFGAVSVHVGPEVEPLEVTYGHAAHTELLSVGSIEVSVQAGEERIADAEARPGSAGSTLEYVLWGGEGAHRLTPIPHSTGPQNLHLMHVAPSLGIVEISEYDWDDGRLLRSVVLAPGETLPFAGNGQVFLVSVAGRPPEMLRARFGFGGNVFLAELDGGPALLLDHDDSWHRPLHSQVDVDVVNLLDAPITLRLGGDEVALAPKGLATAEVRAGPMSIERRMETGEWVAHAEGFPRYDGTAVVVYANAEGRSELVFRGRFGGLNYFHGAAEVGEVVFYALDGHDRRDEPCVELAELGEFRGGCHPNGRNLDLVVDGEWSGVEFLTGAGGRSWRTIYLTSGDGEVPAMWAENEGALVRVETMRPRSPGLRVALVGDPDDAATVVLDDEPLGPVAYGEVTATRPVTPGPHQLDLGVGNGVKGRWDFDGRANIVVLAVYGALDVRQPRPQVVRLRDIEGEVCGAGQRTGCLSRERGAAYRVLAHDVDVTRCGDGRPVEDWMLWAAANPDALCVDRDLDGVVDVRVPVDLTEHLGRFVAVLVEATGAEVVARVVPPRGEVSTLEPEPMPTARLSVVNLVPGIGTLEVRVGDGEPVLVAARSAETIEFEPAAARVLRVLVDDERLFAEEFAARSGAHLAAVLRPGEAGPVLEMRPLVAGEVALLQASRRHELLRPWPSMEAAGLLEAGATVVLPWDPALGVDTAQTPELELDLALPEAVRLVAVTEDDEDETTAYVLEADGSFKPAVRGDRGWVRFLWVTSPFRGDLEVDIDEGAGELIDILQPGARMGTYHAVSPGEVSVRGAGLDWTPIEVEAGVLHTVVLHGGADDRALGVHAGLDLLTLGDVRAALLNASAEPVDVHGLGEGLRVTLAPGERTPVVDGRPIYDLDVDRDGTFDYRVQTEPGEGFQLISFHLFEREGPRVRVHRRGQPWLSRAAAPL